MGGFWLPNGGPKIGMAASFFALEIGLHLEGRFCRSKTAQEVPKSTPRPPQDAIWGSFLAVVAVKLGQVRSKKPKTIVHINVADIAEIDKDKTLQPPGAIKKRRAGGGVPPWGRQSAARPGGCGATACQMSISSRRSRQSCQVLSNSFLHLTANLLWRSLSTSL